MTKLVGLIELSGIGSTIFGVVLVLLGTLLIVFRKQYQAAVLSITNGQSEGRFTYVMKYIYGPLLVIAIGALVLLAHH